MPIMEPRVRAHVAGSVSGVNGPGSRRERLRDETSAEIRTTARARLVAGGPGEMTLRAIARDMGMTAPALYRYFGSHEELYVAVCADVLAELTATLEKARDDAPAGDPVARLGATCRAFRRWALDHRQEFQLIFASGAEAPVVGGPSQPAGPDGDFEMSFGAVFLGLFAEIWQRQPYIVPTDDQLPPHLVSQLRDFAGRVDVMGTGLPLGALATFLGGWVRLFGSVAIEVFGHLGFALDDAEPMFEAMLADMAAQLSTAAR